MTLPFFPRSLRDMGSAVLAAFGSRRRAGKKPPPEAAAAAKEVPREAPQPKPEPATPPLSREWLGKLAQVANALWRLRRRLCDPQTGQPREETRRAFRDLETAWEALQQAGIEIRDHTGDVYDPGYSLLCLAFQPTPGLSREQVIETVKPTITIMGQLVQMGEIIVGIPETVQPEAPSP